MKPNKKMEAALAAYYTTREKRLAGQRAVDALKKEEDALYAAIGALEVPEYAGGGYSLTTRSLAVPQIVDPEMLWAWGQEPGHRAALKVDVVAATWRSYVTAGVTIPGVESYIKTSLVVKEAG